MQILMPLLLVLFFVLMACSGAAIIAAALLQHPKVTCFRCKTVFRFREEDGARWIVHGGYEQAECPCCHRADEIFAENRDWPESPVQVPQRPAAVRMDYTFTKVA